MVVEHASYVNTVHVFDYLNTCFSAASFCAANKSVTKSVCSLWCFLTFCQRKSDNIARSENVKAFLCAVEKSSKLPFTYIHTCGPFGIKDM